jgi:prolyl-tRNA synthetase
VVVLLVKDEGGAGEQARKLADELTAAGVRVRLDDKVSQSFGRRATAWELKGVPVRVEIGPRDLAAGTVTLARRDTGDKDQVPATEMLGQVQRLLGEIQAALLAGAVERRDAHIAEVGTLDQAAEAARTGFARLPWDVVRGDGEARLAADAVTVRCLQRADGSLPASDDETDLVAIVGRSY